MLVRLLCPKQNPSSGAAAQTGRQAKHLRQLRLLWEPQDQLSAELSPGSYRSFQLATSPSAPLSLSPQDLLKKHLGLCQMVPTDTSSSPRVQSTVLSWVLLWGHPWGQCSTYFFESLFSSQLCLWKHSSSGTWTLEDASETKNCFFKKKKLLEYSWCMATHSSILPWKSPWTEEPGGLQSTGSKRVGHNWATKHTRSWFIGLPSKFVKIFPWDVTEKPDELFGHPCTMLC